MLYAVGEGRGLFVVILRNFSDFFKIRYWTFVGDTALDSGYITLFIMIRFTSVSDIMLHNARWGGGGVIWEKVDFLREFFHHSDHLVIPYRPAYFFFLHWKAFSISLDYCVFYFMLILTKWTPAVGGPPHPTPPHPHPHPHPHPILAAWDLPFDKWRSPLDPYVVPG